MAALVGRVELKSGKWTELDLYQILGGHRNIIGASQFVLHFLYVISMLLRLTPFSKQSSLKPKTDANFKLFDPYKN